MSERLAEIEGRCRLATGGPWRWSWEDPAAHANDDRWETLLAADTKEVCSFGNVYIQRHGAAPERADAAFIAHAREDVEWLIRKVETLEREIDAMEQAWEDGEPYE